MSVTFFNAHWIRVESQSPLTLRGYTAAGRYILDDDEDFRYKIYKDLVIFVINNANMFANSCLFHNLDSVPLESNFVHL